MDLYLSHWILYIFYTHVLQLCGKTLAASGNIPGTKDFCLNEGFKAICAEDEVIVMTSAHYGRMNLGRCVMRDYGFVGCGTDVTNHMTRTCSGKQECHVSNLEATFSNALGSCPKDLKPYLEASWDCVKVTQGREDFCSYGYLNVAGNSGYIGNSVTETQGFGSSRCPWVIKAQPGQRINITLVDFSQMGPQEISDSRGVRPRYCREYAVLRETNGANSVVVCDGDPPDKHVYISDGHVVEIEIEKTQSKDANFRFLLMYKILGCPLPDVPAHTHLDQLGDKLSVRCNFTSESWTLLCRDGHWIGVIGNCTQAGVSGMESVIGPSSFLPLGITLMIIIGVAMVICISTLIVGLYHLRSRKRAQELLEQQRKEDSLLYGTARGQELKVENHRFATIDRPGSKHYSQMSGTIRSTTTGGGEYTHIWEVRRPDIPLPDVADSHCGTMSKSPNCATLTKTSQCGTMPKMHHCGIMPKSSQCGGGGTLSKEGAAERNREIKKRASFSTFKPSDDHIYQSPRFGRTRTDLNGIPIHGHLGDAPFYFELDPKMVPNCDDCSAAVAAANSQCGPECETKIQPPNV